MDASRGFEDAEAYQRARPSYAPAAVERLVSELGLGRGSRVLDLAAGTGRLAALLAPRVGALVAVEPSEPMRRVLSRELPAIEVHAATAERLPLDDASLDAVVVAEAFHWFDARAALAEIARVVRPGGGLALLWNVSVRADPPRPPELDRLLAGLRDAAVPDRRRYESGAWREAFDDGGGFGPLASAEFEHTHRLDAAGLVDLVASFSYVAALADGERREVLARVAALAPPASVHTLRTDVYWTRRR
jgi:SAM-dependent methyltransferase